MNRSDSNEQYTLIIKIAEAKNLELLSSGSIWISYQFMENLLQSDQFRFTSNSFPSMCDHFQWLRASTGQIDLYVCSKECILGSAQLRIESLFFDERGELGTNYKELIVNIRSEDKKVAASRRIPQLYVSIELCAQQNDQVISQTLNFDATRDYGKVGHDFDVEPAAAFDESNDKIIAGARETSIAKAELERRQREWSTFQKKEESKFGKHLQGKEEKVRIYLQQQVELDREEHVKTLELCRNEYKKLEARLKKSLAAVEAKEREMKRGDDEREAQHKKRLSEIEIREIILKGEAKHVIGMEGAKLQVSTDRIKLLERELNAANDKYQKLEEKYQESDACKIRNEISRLKGSVVELESVLKREMAEKNVLASEQERYRTAAHKLAKLVRQERSHQRAPMKGGEEIDSLKPNEKGRNVKLQRIKSELSMLE